jgi:hypothetical protein
MIQKITVAPNITSSQQRGKQLATDTENWERISLAITRALRA